MAAGKIEADVKDDFAIARAGSGKTQYTTAILFALAHDLAARIDIQNRINYRVRLRNNIPVQVDLKFDLALPYAVKRCFGE